MTAAGDVLSGDIKPENILLSRGHGLIADFGIAKAVAKPGASNLTSTGTSVGTPLYMSPEQAAGDPHIDHRSDIYSLGCMLYEMLAGEPPFTGPTVQAIIAKHAIEPRPSVRTVRDTVPKAADTAIRRAMAKCPADRFRTVADFAAVLSAAAARAADAERDPPPPETPVRHPPYPILMTPRPDCSAASDRDLVAWAREGLDEAYVELFRRNHRTVRGVLRRMVRDDDLADDLTQETFVRAFRALATQPPDGNVGPWILRIANNLGMDHWRCEGRRKRRGLDTVPLEPTPDITSPRRLRAGSLRSTLAPTLTPTPSPRDAVALGVALEEALARLKETHRRCFVLREIEGRSYDDIAEILDLPVGTVGTCLHRARRELRAALASLHQTLQASTPSPA